MGEPGLSRELILLNAYYKALSHQIRGPLSVISNELQYFQSSGKKDEYAKCLEKCKHIAEILQMSQIPNPTFSMEGLDFLELVNSVFQVEVLQSTAMIVNGDAFKLQMAFTHLKEILNKLSNLSKFKIASDKSSYLLQIHTPLNHPIEKKFDSLSAAVCLELGLDLLTPCLVDAILWAHAVKTSVSLGKDLFIELAFPKIE